MSVHLLEIIGTNGQYPCHPGLAQLGQIPQESTRKLLTDHEHLFLDELGVIQQPLFRRLRTVGFAVLQGADKGA